MVEDDAGHLMSERRTLVHGDPGLCNILVSSGRPVRVIDWENAAVGPAAWDLAQLLDGWGDDGEALFAAYCDEFEAIRPDAFDRLSYRRAFAYASVVHHMWRFSKDVGCGDPYYLAEFLKGVERIRTEMAGRGA